MNADRIEYNLHTALVLHDLNNSDVNKILQSLHYQNNKWYFDNIANAKKFAKLSTYYTREFWGAAHNVALYTVTSAAIKYALQNNIITKEEMHFGIDQQVVQKLRSSNDPQLKELVKIMCNIDSYYVLGKPNDHDIFQPIKMRGIDPLVMQNNKIQRLSELASDFKDELQLTSDHAKNGTYLKFSNIKEPYILELVKNGNM